MNKIKDFIYDKNDLLVALIIVAAAAFIIALRVDVIMTYPASLSEISRPPIDVDTPPISDEISMGGSELDDQEGQEDPDEEKDDTDQDDQEQGQEGEDHTSPPEAEAPVGQDLVSIYIEYGSTGNEIANLLVNSGLLNTIEEFYDAVREAGADTKLQAGNFKIPNNATPAEIVRIITN